MSADTLDSRSDAELIALYGEVMGALRQRGIVRSNNNPIADMAERVIADYYGVDPEPPNNKSFDVRTPFGARVEVKALRRTKASRRGLSPLRTLDFDSVAIVIFALDMRLEEAVLVPLDAVRDHMRWSATWKSNRLSLTQKLLDDPRVERVSAKKLLAVARQHQSPSQRSAVSGR
jgi:hypothetical protein